MKQAVPLRLLHLRQYPIFQQLQLEEALLRADRDNWCLINEGTPPAIVLGISGQPEKLVDRKKLHESPVPLVRRFSGGGTVYVDQQTLFVTFICNTNLIPILPYPEEVLRWSATLYGDVLHDKGFRLIENDYALGNRKCGGNAQYFRKERWLHHSSWLWDFCPQRMQCLLYPPRTPSYRQQRSHAEFLCSLKEHFDNREVFLSRLLEALEERFVLQESTLEESLAALHLPHRKTTQLI